MYEIFSKSALYTFTKRVYLLLLSAFRDTFIHKIFFRDINEKLYENSFTCRIQKLFSKAVTSIEKIMNKILKREENCFDFLLF